MISDYSSDISDLIFWPIVSASKDSTVYVP